MRPRDWSWRPIGDEWPDDYLPRYLTPEQVAEAHHDLELQLTLSRERTDVLKALLRRPWAVRALDVSGAGIQPLARLIEESPAWQTATAP